MSILPKKALLIGINYLSIPANILNGCINDIENMYDMLVTGFQYDPSNIVMLRDDLSNNVLTMPTRQNILNQLNELVSASAGCSEIWINYSGHGTQLYDASGQLTAIDPSINAVFNLDEALVPIDYLTAGFITDNYLFNIIKQFKCRVFLIIDACHSASMCNLEWEFQYVSGSDYIKTQYNSQNIANPNIYIISGCKDSQTSLSVFDISLNEYVGVLTESLIECMKTMNYTGSIVTLYENICTKIWNKGYSQIPILSSTVQVPAYTFTPLKSNYASSNNINTPTVVKLVTNTAPLHILNIAPLPSLTGSCIRPNQLAAYQTIYKEIYEYNPSALNPNPATSTAPPSTTIIQNMKTVLHTKGFINRS